MRWAFAALAPLLLAACPSCNAPDTGPLPQSGGEGVLIRNGQETSYRVVTEESRLLIAVPRAPGALCSVFHSHVMEAGTVVFDFTINADDPGASEVRAQVHAGGLLVDLPENRAVFPELTANDPPLSDRNREDIRVSMLQQLDAEQHPVLTFRAHDLSTVEGDGTATVDAVVRGQQSSLQMDYRAVFEGDRIRVTGTGVLDGAPHGLPSGPVADCVLDQMPLDLVLVLEPGTQDVTLPDAGIPDFEPTFFPDDAECDPVIGFNQARDVLVRRCAGCHQDPPKLGASVPLVEWRDFRVDTRRNPGRPLYQTIPDYLLARNGALPMPPPDATQLSDDELQTALQWIERGGHEHRCEPIPPTTFTTRSPAPCGGSITFSDVEPILQRNCLACHDGSLPGVSPLVTHQDGLLMVEHPFYAPLTRWEASLERIGDGSMPPHLRDGDVWSGDLDEDLMVLQAWVEDGFPQDACAR